MFADFAFLVVSGFTGTPLEELQAGPSCLPDSFTSLVDPQLHTCCPEEFAHHMAQSGYSPEDVAASLEILQTVAAADCFGVDREKLSRQFPALEKIVGQRTRTFSDYVQVGSGPTVAEQKRMPVVVGFPFH